MAKNRVSHDVAHILKTIHHYKHHYVKLSGSIIYYKVRMDEVMLRFYSLRLMITIDDNINGNSRPSKGVGINHHNACNFTF